MARQFPEAREAFALAWARAKDADWGGELADLVQLDPYGFARLVAAGAFVAGTPTGFADRVASTIRAWGAETAPAVHPFWLSLGFRLGGMRSREAAAGASERLDAVVGAVGDVLRAGDYGEEEVLLRRGLDGLPSLAQEAWSRVAHEQSNSLDGLHPDLLHFVTLLRGLALPDGVVQWATPRPSMRGPAEQDHEVRQGRSNTWFGDGNHAYGFAVDSYPIVRNEDGELVVSDDVDHYEPIGRLARQLGLQWGGDWRSFKDRPHVELSNARELRQRYVGLAGPAS